MLESPIYKTSVNSIAKERELAEKIFQLFRNTNCKVNHGFMWRNLHFQVFLKLNPKDQELFGRVYIGLQALGYITVDSDGNFIRLTQKGYDYIYEEEKVEALIHVPWIIPDYDEKQNWDLACNKLLRVIIPQDLNSNPNYISGPEFYSIVTSICDDIPFSYNKYIDDRNNRNLSTSRKDYYYDLINHIDVSKRYLLFVKCQILIETRAFDKINKTEIDIDLDDDISSQKIKIDTENVKSTSEEENMQKEKKNIENPSEEEEHPVVFISYSWDSKEHKEWIRKFANVLIENGIDVILDQYEIRKGALIDDFMERSVNDSERVLCVLTPNYKKKTERLEGGVGEEYSIIRGDLCKQLKSCKYIPILRAGTIETAMPTALDRRDFIDMTNDALFNNKIEEVLRELYNEPKYKKPKLGHKPDFNNMNSSKDAQEYKLIWPK